MKINQLGLILMILLVIYMGGKQIALNRILNTCNSELSKSDTLLLNTTEKYLYSLRLNYLYDSISSEYKSGRELKEKCKECLEITTILNN